MHIGFISYEFPPDTVFGGIGTYTQQMAVALSNAGCQVEVFTASHTREILNEVVREGLMVHRIKAERREIFRERIVHYIKERHQQFAFHILESPEYGAEGYNTRMELKNIPMVVKLHTPNFLIRELNSSVKKQRLKYRIKSWAGLGKYNKSKDKEYLLSSRADHLVSPSVSLKQIIIDKWKLHNESITVLPNPYIADDNLLRIPVNTDTKYINFIGRLETRKGAHLMADVIPKVLKEIPDAHFRFIGRTNVGPSGKGIMLDFLKTKLVDHNSQIEFIDHVTMEEIPLWLSRADICVFPSIWENFPNVCLEAMSAGRGIVASDQGGMKDMLEDIEGGMLVNPSSGEAISNAIIYLLKNPHIRKIQAEKSRKKVIAYYSKEVIEMHLALYEKIIRRSKIHR